MKPITQYRANDGTVFTTEAAALKHEGMKVQVAYVMLPLGNTPRDVEDGKGWVQHSAASYQAAHHGLIKLAKPLFKSWDNLRIAADKDPDSIHPLGFAGRLLDESQSPISDAWRRLGRIDSKFREHQQAYYAINGPRPEHVCVEDRS